MAKNEEMKPGTKYWWSNNFLGVVMVLMLGSYFTYDLMDKHQNRQDHVEFAKQQTINDVKFRNLAMILLNDPNTDSESKAILREYLKIETRSGGPK